MTHVDSMSEMKKEEKERSRDIEAACMRYKSGAVRPSLSWAALLRRRRQRSTPLGPVSAKNGIRVIT
jgi:hypothetical protein